MSKTPISGKHPLRGLMIRYARLIIRTYSKSVPSGSKARSEAVYLLFRSDIAMTTDSIPRHAAQNVVGRFVHSEI